MDRETLKAYDASPEVYANDWHEQPPPSDMHALLRDYFRPGPTADIGCGSGRDTAWLSANGFPAIGYDASAGLLAQARLRYPALHFERAALPDLAGVAGGTFTNVLCETVIMHLAAPEACASVARLVDLLIPGGTLYVSWRVTAGADARDGAGRLYAAFDANAIRATLSSTAIVFDEERVSASSGKTVHRIIARRD